MKGAPLSVIRNVPRVAQWLRQTTVTHIGKIRDCNGISKLSLQLIIKVKGLEIPLISLGKMYPLSTCLGVYLLHVISFDGVMRTLGTNNVGIIASVSGFGSDWDIEARSQSQSSFVRFDKVICFYPPRPESNWMIKWQSFMFHHPALTITKQVCAVKDNIWRQDITSDSLGVCCILKLVKTYIE